MPTCASCGQQNPEIARYCLACATPLGRPASERRTHATIVFCDLSGSTALAERVDAESTRAFMLRYFAEMRTAIERHGGTVEKFIGDAVMAVFGVPQAHEDDALRAVRAAAEMRTRMATLNTQLEARLGGRVAIRIGINTGEVVAGDATARQAIVSGDPVNVAARLEQMAGRDEILLGAETHRLVRHAVVAEPTEPLRVKGKGELVRAFRLLGVDADAPARASAGPGVVVGREAELDTLRHAYAETRRRRRPRLVTVVGEPGSGKSTLAARFAAEADAAVLTGRCLSYGDGITFWPIGEVVRTAAGIGTDDSPEAARTKLRRIIADAPHAGLVARRVAQAIGIEAGRASGEEIAWAFARLVAALARDRPVVLVIDDLQWAEPALLDLVTSLPTAAGEAPVLLLALARPDLLERHPAWDVALRLDRLGAEAIGQLLNVRANGPDLPPALVARIVRRSAGNPLFAEQLLLALLEEGLLRYDADGWVVDSGGVDATVPTTVQALLAARLDRLARAERAAVERGAVEGEFFHRDAVTALSPPPDRSGVPAALKGLVALDLVRPTPPGLDGDAAFAFRHLLLHDAAYAGTTKALRAELHERFAEWLAERWGPRRAEVDAILGHHFAEAHRYRTELGLLDDDARRLAIVAARHLAAAGQRAFDRSDVAGAAALLQRADAVLPTDLPRRDVLTTLGAAIRHTGDVRRAEVVLRRAEEEARSHGDRRAELRASIERALLHSSVDPSADPEALLRLAEHARSEFEEDGDERAQAETWRLVAQVENLRLRWDACGEALRHGLAHAERGGDERQQAEIITWLALAIVSGSTPVPDAKAFCEAAAARHAEHPFLTVTARGFLGVLRAMDGEPDEGRALVEQTTATLDGLGLVHQAATGGAFFRAQVELLDDRPDEAERVLRAALTRLEAIGDAAGASSLRAVLARALYAQGRHSEGEMAARRSIDESSPHDRLNHIIGLGVIAKVEARRRSPEAEHVARQAVTLAVPTDDLLLHGDALMDLAEVLALLGRDAEAAVAIRGAVTLYDRKGDRVRSRKARAVLVRAETGAARRDAAGDRDGVRSRPRAPEVT